MTALQGSIVGSCTYMYLTDRFGFGKVRRSSVKRPSSLKQLAHLAMSRSSLVVSPLCCFILLRLGPIYLRCTASVSLMAAYCLEAAAVPFPVFVLAYFFNGFGTAFLVRHLVLYPSSCHTDRTGLDSNSAHAADMDASDEDRTRAPMRSLPA